MVKTRIDRLQRLESELERIIGQCGNNKIERCRILEALGDHNQCTEDNNGEIISMKSPRQLV
ncbi:MAG: hypothetical protein HQM14_21535 [SAR324 cluster bacterium]|nr:hypothetical protein [SAR324 cluster bacterium]